MWQVLCHDSVLGWRIGGGAEADDRVGQQGVNVEEHHAAADDLDRVTDEHHAPLGHRVGKCTDKRSQGNVGDSEEGLQQRLISGWRMHFTQSGNGNDEQGVVGKRGKKLRRHDDVKAEGHREIKCRS